MIFEEMINKVINGDCLDVMKSIPDNSIDLIVTDPPYGITKNEWDKPVILRLMWESIERIVKNEGIIIFTSVQPFTTDLISSNRKLFRYELIFEKTLGSGFLNAKKMPLRTHENILIFYKEISTYNPIMGRGINKRGYDRRKDNGTNYGAFTKKCLKYDDKGTRYPTSIIRISTGNRNTEHFHPTQKPIKLIEYLIRTYSNENDLVLDPFLGSGTTAVASLMLNRRFIGIEKDENYCKIAEQRIKAVPERLTKFLK